MKQLSLTEARAKFSTLMDEDLSSLGHKPRYLCRCLGEVLAPEDHLGSQRTAAMICRKPAGWSPSGRRATA